MRRSDDGLRKKREPEFVWKCVRSDKTQKDTRTWAGRQELEPCAEAVAEGTDEQRYP